MSIVLPVHIYVLLLKNKIMRDWSIKIAIVVVRSNWQDIKFS